MKKAKIMLTVIAGLGIAGIAVAFKVHRTPMNYIGCDSNGLCRAVKNNGLPWTTVDQGLGSFPGTATGSFKTCSSDADCGTLYIAAE